MKNIYKERITCRLCGGSFEKVLELGNTYLNDFVDTDKEIVSAPLTLVKCTNCELVQLKHTADLDRLYRQYWYQSSLNKSMVASLQDVINNVETRIHLTSGDTVIDIGCNDGTMLSQYHVDGLYKIGIDPAINLAEKAQANCDLFINDYFGNYNMSLPTAKVITTIAMFYDLEDPHVFIELVKQSLDKNGIWVIQFTDLFSMFKINAFDNICHEHLEYYSFKVLKNLLEQHNLDIFDVSTNNVNGGSVRAYVCWKGARKVEATVIDHLLKEIEYMLSFDDPFKAFSERVNNIKQSTISFILDQNTKGKIVAAMGASTKGNTLLQYFGLTNKEIKFAGEVNPDKFGKKTVATNVPIISEKEALVLKPDYFLLLPWHFKESILAKNQSYLQKGGHFIIPCPQFEII
jgi:SAM-dependent methyltransferase